MTTNNNSEKKNNFKPNGFNNNNLWIIGLIVAALFALQLFNLGPSAKEISWVEFERDMLKNQEVTKIVIVNREKAEVYLKPEVVNSGKYTEELNNGFGSISQTGPHFFFTIGSIEMFEKRLEQAQEDFAALQEVEVSYETRKDVVGELIGWLLPIIILVAIWLFIFRRMSGGGAAGGGNIFSIGKSRAKVFDKEENKVKTNFNDVAGLDEAKVEISEIVDFLKSPLKYTDLGGKIPKGALLVGPPGTGKTLLAKAVAGEANVPFFSLSGSDFVEMFVGVGASRVRDLFSQAKQKAPCIIFIDEIDAIGRARGKNPNFGANDERENTLNQLLTEMDGFDTNTGVIILAATNRADILDPALLRAGRFDRQITVEMPDLNERREIFKVHMKPLKLSESVNFEFLAKQTPGFSGADIANVCNEAALIAARKNKKAIEKQDFLDAVDRIIGGLEKRSKIITPEEKKRIAYHEAGHATISWFLEFAHPLVKVTIVPRGRALGAAWYLPEERQLNTVEQIHDEICATLGGRASEEIVFGNISTGALNDLEKVNKQSYAMVAYFGMSDTLKNISYFDSSGRSEYSFSKPYSENTAEIIDKEAKAIVSQQYDRAINLLKVHHDGLKKLAETLLEREVIFTEDLISIFGERPFKKVQTLTSVAEEVKDDELNVENEVKVEVEIENNLSDKIDIV
jgi:cell division protease FtsH